MTATWQGQFQSFTLNIGLQGTQAFSADLHPASEASSTFSSFQKLPHRAQRQRTFWKSFHSAALVLNQGDGVPTALVIDGRKARFSDFPSREEQGGRSD